MVTIDEAHAMLDEIAESLPPEFYRELNGGIVLLPDVKTSEYARNGDLYIMGEYHRGGPMGRWISIYYGSFEQAHGHLPPEAFREKLRETLLHEFTHHLESLAGERGLEVWDEERLREYLDRSAGPTGTK